MAEGVEGNRLAIFTVSLSEPSDETVTVQYATANGSSGSASPGTDYTQVALTTLTFNPGEVSKTFYVAITGDTGIEEDETFSVILRNPLNATIGDGEALGTIFNDDFVLKIAPNHKRIGFIDVDGDRVMLQTTRGSLSEASLVFAPDGKLLLLDLNGYGNSMAGADITLRVKQRPGGNGLVDPGAIDAAGMNLGKVAVPGEPGRIDVGDGRGKALEALSVGSLGGGSLNPVTQMADGSDPLLSHVNGSLGKLSVQGEMTNTMVSVLGSIVKAVIGGNVTNAQILAGYDTLGEAKNPNASIGSVIVKGNWSGSNLVAGVQDVTRDGFGQGDEMLPGGSGLVASIARVVIRGTASGTSASGDFFGITAPKLGKLEISGATVPLSKGADDLLLDSTSNDFRVVDFL